MNTATRAATSLAQARQRGAAWWSRLALRERRLLGAMLAVVGSAVIWLVLIQPAWRTVRAAPATLDQLDAQLQQTQRVAAESLTYSSATPVSVAQASLALQAATEQLGEQARVVMQGDRATLTLTGVDSEDLQGWLTEARSAARARPIEAQLTRSPQGYSGTLVVQLAGTP